MNNTDVERRLEDCSIELDAVRHEVVARGSTSPVAPYLTKYSLIRACGTIEYAFKAIIVDYCSLHSEEQARTFIERRVGSASANPSFAIICRFLGDFDDRWKENFKARISGEPDALHLRTSLQSLVDARNQFAHGDNPSISLGDIIKCFICARHIIGILDEVVS
jgi:HEPN superfamily RiboL-PSP-like protein